MPTWEYLDLYDQYYLKLIEKNKIFYITEFRLQFAQDIRRRGHEADPTPLEWFLSGLLPVERPL